MLNKLILFAIVYTEGKKLKTNNGGSKELTNNRRQIQSIVRAFQIVELFNTYGRELSILEISNYMNLPKSTVHGIVSTLFDLGYLKQNHENSRYSLGFKFLGLSTSLLNMTDLIKVSRPHLHELAEKTNETAHLAILQEGDTFYIDKVQPVHGLTVSSQIGRRLPAYCTGLGKLLLAYCPESEIRKLFKGKDLQKYTKNTKTNLDDLLREFKKIREIGLSFDNEEYNEGLSCIAAPIYDHHSCVVASISIAGPTQRIIRNRKDNIEMIKMTSLKISEGLGYKYDQK